MKDIKLGCTCGLKLPLQARCSQTYLPCCARHRDSKKQKSSCSRLAQAALPEADLEVELGERAQRERPGRVGCAEGHVALHWMHLWQSHRVSVRHIHLAARLQCCSSLADV